MVGGSIINDYAAQQSPTCLELPIGVDYKIAFSPSYNEAVLKQANGQPVDLPAIYSYALTDHYLIGRTAESQGGYFWFDLETQTAKRFAYDQRSEFIQSVKDLGFAEAPLSLTIEEQCRASQCQPCPYGAK